LKALTLHDDDEVLSVQITDGTQSVLIATKDGYSVRFVEADVRIMGRTAAGVRGIRLRENDLVIGADVVDDTENVLVITEKGYGKQTPATEYPIKGRGGKGIKTANITDKNGVLAGMTIVRGDEDIMVTTTQGVMIRFAVSSVSQTGRATLGVRLIRLEDGAKVATLAKVEHETTEDVSRETEEVIEQTTQIVEQLTDDLED
ncbi:MAG: DNA gyrase C-terminal beta-propeller domain-containing protein, partial [Leuconostoc lactis]